MFTPLSYVCIRVEYRTVKLAFPLLLTMESELSFQLSAVNDTSDSKTAESFNSDCNVEFEQTMSSMI